MPYDGLFSFLRYRAEAEVRAITVSMPYDGLFSFLLAKAEAAANPDDRVNAL